MRVQTPGEQKYDDFIGERARVIRTGMIIWVSLLAAALFAFAADKVTGSILMLIGAALAAVNLNARKQLKNKLDIVEDKEEFFRQLTALGTTEVPEYHIIITQDYVLYNHDTVSIIPVAEIEKAQVQEPVRGNTILFLQMKDGTRKELAAAPAHDSKLGEALWKAYRALPQ